MCKECNKDSRLTRAELVEAIKVPVIMGRGAAYGVVIGISRYYGFLSWLHDNNPEAEKSLLCGDGTVLGMQAIVTVRHPDTLFAVTESEYDVVLERLGGNQEPMCHKQKKVRCTNCGCFSTVDEIKRAFPDRTFTDGVPDICPNCCNAPEEESIKPTDEQKKVDSTSGRRLICHDCWSSFSESDVKTIVRDRSDCSFGEVGTCPECGSEDITNETKR